MTLQGTFKDINDQFTYTVIITNEIGSITYNIVDPLDRNFNPNSDNQFFFGPDPVHITCERSDLTQLIMIAQATINLKVNGDVSDMLFADTNRDIKVIIKKGDYTVFFGFVDPLQFNQGFASKYETITITATDPLGALETLTIDQTDINQEDQINVINFISKIFERTFDNMSYNHNLLYNGVLTYFNNNIDPSSIKINASIFYGEDKDDRMTLYDSLNEVLKYLGCTIAYEPHGKYVHMYNMYSITSTPDNSTPWFDGKDDSLDMSTNISMDDVYNQITLKCDIEPVDEKIELLDNDSLYSDYDNYQKYMTELVAPGEDMDAYNGFKELLNSPDNDEHTLYEKGYRLDHFCYVKRNDAWSFGQNSYITAMNGTEKSSTSNKTKMTGDQSDVLQWLKSNPIKAAFVAFGKGNKIQDLDNSLISNIPMNDCLVISICGHDDHTQNGGHNNVMFNQIQANAPICTYKGLSSLNLNPTDPTITNYIVISGKIVLNTLQPKTGIWNENEYTKSEDNTYELAKTTINNENKLLSMVLLGKTVPSTDDGDGAYYAQKWWKCSDPNNPNYIYRKDYGIFEFLENKENEKLKYSWTTYGSDTDKISKLPILACQLKIGDKWCVERLDEGNAGQGKFEWMTDEEWAASDLYTMGFQKPYFTIGIDPKTDDNIVGHSYSIQNNINYTQNLEVNGTAIPIKITDQLNGTPEFTILGPINSMWNEIERINPSFWRHTGWQDHKYWVLEMLDSIIISDFDISFTSDNAGYSESMTTADNDLVYASDMNPSYIEKLENEIKICTPLTIHECIEKGIKYQISNSYVYKLDNTPFYGWTYNGETYKPEHLFVDYYYKQYCRPARIVNVNVSAGYAFGQPTSESNSYLGLATVISKYIVNMEFPGIVNPNRMSDDFYNYYVMSIDWSLKHKDTNMSMREVLDYEQPFS